jgi:hypothetical protein
MAKKITGFAAMKKNDPKKFAMIQEKARMARMKKK